MAEDDLPDPTTLGGFRDHHKMLNYQFEEYREWGRGVNTWTTADKLGAYDDYLAKPLPAPGRPRKFVAKRRWIQRRYRSSSERKINIDGPLDEYIHDERYERLREIQRRNESFRRFFHSKSVELNLLDCCRRSLIAGPPRCVMVKTLAWGGNGLAVRYKYRDSRKDTARRDIVVKTALRDDGRDHLLLEERTTNVSLTPAETDEGEANIIQESKKVSPLYPSDRSP